MWGSNFIILKEMSDGRCGFGVWTEPVCLWLLAVQEPDGGTEALCSEPAPWTMAFCLLDDHWPELSAPPASLQPPWEGTLAPHYYQPALHSPRGFLYTRAQPGSENSLDMVHLIKTSLKNISIAKSTACRRWLISKYITHAVTMALSIFISENV